MTPNKCSNCGANLKILEDNQVYCRYCGATYSKSTNSISIDETKPTIKLNKEQQKNRVIKNNSSIKTKVDRNFIIYCILSIFLCSMLVLLALFVFPNRDSDVIISDPADTTQHPTQTVPYLNITYNYMFDDKIEERKYFVADPSMITLLSPTRLGYTFSGWYDTPTYTLKITTLSSTNNSDICLYAKWQGNKVYLSYDGNNCSSGTMTKQVCIVGESVTLLDNSYTKDGYIFVGWTTEATSNNVLNSLSKFVVPATNLEIITLFAKWKKEVYTLEDFNYINANNTCFYELKTNLDFLNYSFKNIEKFFGQLNGNGYKISNIPNSFIYENCGEIINLNIETFNNTSTYNIIGGFVAQNRGSISNCSVKGKISSNAGLKYSSVGGFCGNNYGVINNCFSNMIVSMVISSGEIGGFVGSVGNKSQIINSYSKGNLTIKNSSTFYSSGILVGGFVAKMYNVKDIIRQCYSDVNIEADYTQICGGFIGHYAANGEISTCFALGKINANSLYIGGFAGSNLNSNCRNIYRSDINLFNNTNTIFSGTLIEHQSFFSKNFYFDNNLFCEYLNDNNTTRVWIIQDGQLPKLYWQ